MIDNIETHETDEAIVRIHYSQSKDEVELKRIYQAIAQASYNLCLHEKIESLNKSK